jgi:multidrug resistance efflux pump
MDLGRRRQFSAVVWGFGVVVAVLWGSVRKVEIQAMGLGHAESVQIAATEDGRLRDLDVHLHDEVMAGDVVASLDPAPLEELKSVLSAELLSVQEEAARVAAADARRFAQGVEGTQLDRARLNTGLHEDEARKSALVAQIGIERELLGRGASSEQAVRALQRELDVLTARVTAGREAVRLAGAATVAATGRQIGQGELNQWQVVAATRRMDALEARLERLKLSSSIDGQVTWVYRTPGEVVRSGEPIVEVTQGATQEVLAYVSAHDATRLEPGRSAKVQRASGATLSGTLVSVGSAPREVPPALWHSPSYPEWGVPVRIELDANAVAPQEPVVVRL